MKKSIAFLLTALMALTFIASALAEGGSGKFVTVHGEAGVSLTADGATVEIGARTIGATVAEAQEKNTEVMKKVLAAVEKTGIPKENIVTRMYSVDSYDEDGGYLSSGKRRTKFSVHNTVFVTVKDLSLLGSLLDNATTAGANNVWGLSFFSSEASRANHKALGLAVEDARHRAETLAAAAGKKLGDIVYVKENGLMGGGYGITNDSEMMKKGGLGDAIVTGDVSVEANVEVQFELLD